VMQGRHGGIVASGFETVMYLMWGMGWSVDCFSAM